MRAKKIKPRQVSPDPRYNSVLVAKLVNRVMRDGKKSAAQKQVYAALEQVATELKGDAVELLDKVIQTVTPQMEVRSRRVGGAAYQVPMPVKGRRGLALAIRWLVLEANKRPSSQFKTFGEKLAAEMLDALEETGGAIQRRDTSHRMAEANRAFAHFRW